LIKSQDDLNQDDGVGRTMTLLKAIEQLEKTEVELEKVEKQLKIAVEALEDIGFCKTSIYQNSPFKLVSWAIDAISKIKELDK
jgi:hypothetical protein